MFVRFLPVLLALVLVCSLGFAVQSAPTDLAVEFVGYSSVKISWAHAGGSGVSFNVYRGDSVETAVLRGSSSENFFVDSGVLGSKEYVYFVTAVDSTGENLPLYSVSIIPDEKPENPFELILLYPDREEFAYGEKLELIVGVESSFFYELENLRVELVDLASGEATDFSFDEKKRIFVLSKTLPLEGALVNYRIKATADVLGEEFSDSEDYKFFLSDLPPTDFWPVAVNIFLILGIPIILLLIGSGVALVSWRKAVTRENAKEGSWIELVDLLKQKSVWKIEALKQGLSKEEYAEKDLEFQIRQDELEGKLGRRQTSFETSINPFAGFNEDEINEIVTAVKRFGARKKTMTSNQMQSWLEKQGKSERIAKKIAEAIYGKNY